MSGRPILVVALPDSVHTARWMRMVHGEWPLVLIPATKAELAPELGRTWPVRALSDLLVMPRDAIGVWAAQPEGPEFAADDLPAPIGFLDRDAIVRGATVARAVRVLRPLLLHSMEIQLAGYACLVAHARLDGDAPPWLLSNWGSDIFLYHRLAEHRLVLEAIAARIDAALNECERDVPLLRGLGFDGRILPAQPASGGVDVTILPRLEALAPPSGRRLILVKGYHGWAGRALHALSAIHLAAPALRRHRIRVLLASPVVRDMAARIAAADGLDIGAEPWMPNHAAALARMGAARMMVSCGISDGIGTTLLEAMALGAFPIVSESCCALEWLEAERDGFVVSPHDVAGLAKAIARAAAEDALVDAAAPRNRATVEARWDIGANGGRAKAAYREVIAAAPGRSAA
ncbi:glycosyltransferase family 4 protein [Roseomonas eburnea]|uniref:Glycosyltransferase family 4 protein n=1 Tax=Neoroseomonas eburnea TaxID=1346889 RepID=A0A9X9XCY2_9PROT|nr:glycosyltransferase [Neoroseomonas eburnea]MBR0681568.1 glycosyltransferase family 4 protein [Neoroseomonas eburnea]